MYYAILLFCLDISLYMFYNVTVRSHLAAADTLPSSDRLELCRVFLIPGGSSSKYLNSAIKAQKSLTIAKYNITTLPVIC